MTKICDEIGRMLLSGNSGIKKSGDLSIVHKLKVLIFICKKSLILKKLLAYNFLMRIRK